MADTPFTTFAFAATGGSATRTMPDRLGEIKNVMDFGADPTNVADSAPAVQAATNAVMSAGGGVVHFPLGFYKQNSSINFNDDTNFGIVFRGDPGTVVDSSVAGYAFDRHLATPNNTRGVRGFEGLHIQNGNGGCIRLGSTNGAFIRDCRLGGFIGFTSEDSPGVSSQNLLFENVSFGGNTAIGSKGLIMGGSGAMVGCDFIACDKAVVAYGNGFAMAGMRNEDNNTAYQFGLDSAGTNRGMSGFSVAGSTEGCLNFMHFAGTCSGGFIGPIGFNGHATSGPFENTPSHSGLIIDANMAQGCTFFNVTTSGYFDVAGISIANASARANNVFIACGSSVASGGGSAWVLPTNAWTARFLQSSIQPVWTFSQLPTGGNVFEGDEFDISDSNSATWGANVTAGAGSNRVVVRWNGSNYTVVGK